MLHTKRIGRIAPALSIVLFGGVILAANAALPTWYKSAASQPFISLPDTQSSSRVIFGQVASSAHNFYTAASQVLVVDFKQNFNLNTAPSGAQLA